MTLLDVNIENGGRTTHFGGPCYFIFIFCSRCSISMLWRFTVTFDDTKPPPEAVNGHIVLVQIFTRFGALANVTWTRPRLGGLPHLESFTWQNATPARRVTLPGRPGKLPHLSCKHDQIKMRDYMERRVTPPRRVTSPTWGPPPPCKQALIWNLSILHCLIWF